MVACSLAVTAFRTPIDKPEEVLPLSFGGGQYGGCSRLIHKSIGVRGIVGSAADPPGVEQRISALAPITEPQWESEDISPLHKEGPFLGIKGLKSVQVKIGRVSFHLAEIGVHRQIQCAIVG